CTYVQIESETMAKSLIVNRGWERLEQRKLWNDMATEFGNRFKKAPTNTLEKRSSLEAMVAALWIKENSLFYATNLKNLDREFGLRGHNKPQFVIEHIGRTMYNKCNLTNRQFISYP